MDINKKGKESKEKTGRGVSNKLLGFKTSIASKTKKINMSLLKKVIIAILVIAILYVFRGYFVVAVVNNYPITRLSVIKELEKQGGSQVLESIISERLIMQEAAKKNVKVTKEDIEKELKIIEDNLKAQGTDLQTALSMQGQTKDDLEKAISLKLLIEKTLADKITTTEDEVKKYFDDNKLTLYKDKILENVKEDIKNTLEQQKLSTEYQKWISEIREKAQIINFLNYGTSPAN